MYQTTISPSCKTPKYRQIIQTILADIERGKLKVDEQLPSINELSEEYLLARDTVERAYRELREQGHIVSIHGKGYFVAGNEVKKQKILLIFNKLSSYKKIIYYSFLKGLGEKATVDLHIHHYDAHLFKEIINKNLGKYNYYVVMPHFFHNADKAEYLQAIKRIPKEELIILDKDLPELDGKYLSVYQDFNKDIFKALESTADLLAKYQKLVLIFPFGEHYPLEIMHGFRQFCNCYNKRYAILENTINETPSLGTAYVTVEETDLADLIKKSRGLNYTLGKDLGIISFNETTSKELLDITVITTDFELMGHTAATLLLEHRQGKVKNPFKVIRRGSL
jgi:DNA-binding transcriptional regulator YhcF (GntR family)